MTAVQAFILGLVQGLTEFIPVSSSGHLVLIPEILHWKEQQSTAFDVILHSGSLVALLIYFNKYLLEILFKDKKLIVNIIIASIPALIIGYLLQDFIDTNLKSTWVVISSMISIGILMLFSDKLFKNQTNTLEKMTNKTALTIGISQALALIRGVSRSGITMLTGLYFGFTRKEAARFSFLMAIPVIAAATGYEILKITLHNSIDENFTNLAIGFVTSLTSSLIAIKLMLKFLEKHNLKVFGIYRIILGLILVALTLL